MKELVFYVLGEVNHLAVFIAALANFVLGAIWYSPLMFAKAWSKLNFGDIDMEEMKKKVNVGFVMGLAFASTWLMAYALSIPMVMLEVMQFKLPIILCFTLFITGGFIVMNMFKHSLFEMKSFKLVLINRSHDFAVMIVMALIISSMQEPDVERLQQIMMNRLN